MDDNGTNAGGENQQDAGNQTKGVTDTQSGQTAGQQAGADVFAELDTDTREWLGKRELKTPADVAKLAREQASLLGNAVRLPKEGAPQEEIDAFLNKLGRPEKEDGYKFKVPEQLPEGLPYDGERAKAFASFAHGIGLTQKQAAAIHDWAAGNAVKDFGAGAERLLQQTEAQSKAATEALVKQWGPLDGTTAKANLVFADRALQMFGGDEVAKELEAKGMIADINGQRVVLSAPIATMFAKIGGAFVKEDDVLRGQPEMRDNPFATATENRTALAQIIKTDKDRAYQLIAAAGRSPSEFGLPNR